MARDERTVWVSDDGTGGPPRCHSREPKWTEGERGAWWFSGESGGTLQGAVYRMLGRDLEDGECVPVTVRVGEALRRET